MKAGPSVGKALPKLSSRHGFLASTPFSGGKWPQETVIWTQRSFGAGNEARTRDLNLGKVALYQLSYSRPKQRRHCRAETPGVKNTARRNASKALNPAAIPPPCRRAPRSQPGAASQFRPGHAQVLNHRPERENRRHP